jgi:hypothetical protein
MTQSQNPAKIVEHKEMFQLLKAAGLQPLLDGLETPGVISKVKGRLKKSTLARAMNVSVKEVEQMLSEARDILS